MQYWTNRRGLVAGATLCMALTAVLAQRQTEPLGVASYTTSGQLEFPRDTSRWVWAGSGIGGTYGEEPFDPANPGAITVVRMEPAAYEYLVENGHYADGTMLLLTFYRAQDKPDPQLRGLVQGEALQSEIHVIDRQRFTGEGRAFFVYPGSSREPATAMPVGSECVICHTEHGNFDGTFSQFYPGVRSVLPEASQ